MENFSAPLWAQNDSLEDLIALLPPLVLASSTVLVGRRAASLGFLTWESLVLKKKKTLIGEEKGKLIEIIYLFNPYIQSVMTSTWNHIRNYKWYLKKFFFHFKSQKFIVYSTLTAHLSVDAKFLLEIHGLRLDFTKFMLKKQIHTPKLSPTYLKLSNNWINSKTVFWYVLKLSNSSVPQWHTQVTVGAPSARQWLVAPRT